MDDLCDLQRDGEDEPLTEEEKEAMVIQALEEGEVAVIITNDGDCKLLACKHEGLSDDEILIIEDSPVWRAFLVLSLLTGEDPPQHYARQELNAHLRAAVTKAGSASFIIQQQGDEDEWTKN